MRSTSAALPRDLAAARRRIDRWRAKNARRRPIPEATWTEAVDLARVHGIYRVSRTMRLRYDKLKDRVQAKPTATVRAIDTRPLARFVEVAPLPTPSFVSVEITDGEGRCMAVRGADHAQVLSLVATFCGR